eukprot:TRINITY_DN9144_c0_g1_i3.p2 TRINITY_DN9144_c0_g1~~TRINITY_DN9144_c0_g1_i3.p2  ORF type:complete len:137 (-),score=19.52 TRINITY_DN9144_c0_g1_i3:890-1300(-)
MPPYTSTEPRNLFNAQERAMAVQIQSWISTQKHFDRLRQHMRVQNVPLRNIVAGSAARMLSSSRAALLPKQALHQESQCDELTPHLNHIALLHCCFALHVCLLLMLQLRNNGHDAAVRWRVLTRCHKVLALAQSLA